MRDCLELLVLLTYVSYASVPWSKGYNLMWWMRSNFGPYQSWLPSPEEFNSSHLGPTKIKPGVDWFQIVGSGILHIVMHGNPDEGSLLKVLEPLLSRLSHSSWTALDVNVMWNSKRPVWFQASIKMLRIWPVTAPRMPRRLEKSYSTTMIDWNYSTSKAHVVGIMSTAKGSIMIVLRPLSWLIGS